MGFKPIYGLFGTKCSHGTLEFFGASGVVFGEGFGVEAGVGEVAAAAARDFDF